MLVKTIDELRNVIDQNNKNQGSIQIELEPFGEYEFDGQPIVINSQVTIDGQYAHINCNYKVVFFVVSSNTTISKIKFEHVTTAVCFDGYGRHVDNVEVNHIQVKDYIGSAIAVNNSKSNSKLTNVRILNNEIVGKTGLEEETIDGFTMAIAICAARAPSKDPVDNCVIDGVEINHNRTYGGHRFGINLTTSSCDYNKGMENCGTRDNVVLRNVKILNNDLKGGWDSTINFIGGLGLQKSGLMENVEIGYNHVVYGIWGMAVVAEEPLFGGMSDSICRNFEVHHNTWIPIEGGAGELEYAIAFCSGRIDYFHNCYCERAWIDDVKVHHNEIYNTDRGFLISATDSVLDGLNSRFVDCRIKNIEISDNKLIGVKDAFMIVGAYFEGRLIDWNIGLPPHIKHWQDLLPSHDVTTCTLDSNYVEGVKIKNNYIKGNRYMYRLHACFGHGHALFKNNRLSIDEISNNKFEDYECHADIKAVCVDDWCKDEGNNVFDETWKMKI